MLTVHQGGITPNSDRTIPAMHIEGCGSREKGHLKIEAMGSYRRGEETSGDLDILITRDPSDGKDHTRKLNRTSKRCLYAELSSIQRSFGNWWPGWRRSV